MDARNISIALENNNVLSNVACNVRILLVDHNTTSLLYLATQLEQQLYKGDDLLFVFLLNILLEIFLLTNSLRFYIHQNLYF